mgnify:CR=1 FL=1|jgi:hypothetical protein
MPTPTRPGRFASAIFIKHRGSGGRAASRRPQVADPDQAIEIPPVALICAFGETPARMRARSCSVAPLHL